MFNLKPVAVVAASACSLTILLLFSLDTAALQGLAAHWGPSGGAASELSVRRSLAHVGLPPGFDWKSYIFNNPDLGNNITTEAAAAFHYTFIGRYEGRIFKKVPIYLSYNPKWGLCNQLWDHIHMLGVASYLNASLVRPTAYSRDSRFGYTKRFGKFSFFKVPLETLLDVAKVEAHWRERGVEFVQQQQQLDEERCLLGDMAEEMQGLAITRDPWSVEEAGRRILANVRRLAQPVLGEKPSAHVCVHLDMHNPLTLIHGRRSLPYMTAAAQGLFFNETLERAANTIRAALAASGPTYQGVHLRIEKDWGFFVNLKQDLVGGYVSLMQRANYSNASACYVASGVFSYQQPKATQALAARLKRAGVCSSLFYHQALLQPKFVAGLNQEQRALIDLLVLSHAEKLVGDTKSTFSHFARELRALNGLSKHTFFSVKPGYNLSEARGIFVPDDGLPSSSEAGAGAPNTTK